MKEQEFDVLDRYGYTMAVYYDKDEAIQFCQATPVASEVVDENYDTIFLK